MKPVVVARCSFPNRLSRRLPPVFSLLLLGSFFGCQVKNTALAATAAKPATVAEAARVLDLSTFPLMEGAPSANQRRVAGLFYEAKSTVAKAFEFQKQTLVAMKWQEQPNSYVSDQSASATFSRDGYAVSVSVFAGGKPDTARVSLTQHGNVDLGRLPVPPGTTPLYAMPITVAYITAASLDETTEACRKLLLAEGWQPYGRAGDSHFFKQNAVRLLARVASAPAQGGKTVISFTSELMSVDLPAPPKTERLSYADATTTLSFDTASQVSDVFAFYRDALSKAGWKATTEKPFKIRFKESLIFRNSAKDMLTLETHTIDGKTRALLKHENAAEIAEIERLIQAEAKRKKMEKGKPKPKIAVAVPASAKELKQTKSRIEFTIDAGKAKAIVEAWRKQYRDAGWKEELATLEAMAGAVSFTKNGQDLSITYVDTGIMPAEISVSGIGVELEKAGGKE